MSKKLLVVGAHSADFVWRSAGTIAVTTSQGGTALVLALSYGERGESGELWKEPGQTIENVKRIRHEQAAAAAEVVGATFRSLDLGDYPLTMTEAAMEQLVEVFREEAPDVVLTHTPVDPFNPPKQSPAAVATPDPLDDTPDHKVSPQGLTGILKSR
jgi:4-oxalomesaconate hydratase